MKRILSVLMIVFSLFAIVGCSQTPATEEAVTQEASQESSAEATEAEPVELEDKVVVYSTHSEAMLEAVAIEFEKETGVKVEFINLKGELADRVRAEAENPQSDVMFGAASSVFLELKEEDLFEAYAPSWSEKINPLFKDVDNTFFGTIQTPVVMFYNTDLISAEDAPKDWSDLANEKYTNQFVFRNALSSSARATYSALLQQYEKQGDLQAGWDYLAAVDANTKQYFGSGSLQFQAIGRKEAGISFATLSSVIDNRENNNMPLEIVNATSGSPIITDCIGMIKNAKHPNAAKAFIDFAGGEKIQTLYANEFNRMPTHPDAINNAPAWMAEIELNIMDVDWGKLSQSQSEWMQKWDSEIKDTKKDS
jgi:iron(III) transport system substrate-binding protein